MINNPDDMGDLQPAHQAVGRRRPLRPAASASTTTPTSTASWAGSGPRARLRRLHVHAPQDLRRPEGWRRAGRRRLRLLRGVGARSCRVRWCDGDGERYALEQDAPHSIGRVREFLGNVPQVVKAYSWARAMGADGIGEAADLSVLANNYMESRLLAIPGVTEKSRRHRPRRLEMTRYSLGETDRGDRGHRGRRPEPDGRLRRRRPVAQPRAVDRSRAVHPRGGRAVVDRRTSTTGSTSLAQVCEEAYESPEVVKSAPHNQVIHRLDPVESRTPTIGRPLGARTFASTVSEKHRRRGRASEVPGKDPAAALRGTSLAVVGGGSIGVGWAVAFAGAGAEVTLYEPDARPSRPRPRGGARLSLQPLCERAAGRGPGARRRIESPPPRTWRRRWPAQSTFRSVRRRSWI